MPAARSRFLCRLDQLADGDLSLAGLVALHLLGGVVGARCGEVAISGPRWQIQLSDRRSTFVGGWLCRIRRGAPLVGWGVAPSAVEAIRAARRAVHHKRVGGSCCGVCGEPVRSVYVGHNARVGRCAAHELRHEAAAVYLREPG